ncbi:MAG: hypothetical protein QM680_09765 [Luteolibacter sp.]
MKTIIYGKQPISPESKAVLAKLEANPAFRRRREIFAKVRDGTANAEEMAEYREMRRPFEDGPQDVVRG